MVGNSRSRKIPRLRANREIFLHLFAGYFSRPFVVFKHPRCSGSLVLPEGQPIININGAISITGVGLRVNSPQSLDLDMTEIIFQSFRLSSSFPKKNPMAHSRGSPRETASPWATTLPDSWVIESGDDTAFS